MISKYLTIAAAIVLISGMSAAPAFAQTAPAAPASAPAPAAAAPAPAAPAVSAPAPKPAASASTENPYGLADVAQRGGIVSKTVLGLLLIMSVGSWFIFFTKYFDQSRILAQARTVERRFWTSGTLNEGIDKLPKTSMFRSVAESGVRASQGGTSLVNLN